MSVCVRMCVRYLCYIKDNFAHNQKYQYHLIKYVYIFVLVLCITFFNSLIIGDGIGQDKGRHKTKISNI